MCGVPGWFSQLSSWVSDFGSGHDLAVHEFEPMTAQLTAQLGACFRFYVPFSFCLSPAHILSVCLSVCLSLSLSLRINKTLKRRKESKMCRGTWVAQLSVRLLLRSWSCGSWVQALHRVLCCQQRARIRSSVSLSLSLSLSLCLSLCPSLTCYLSQNK